MIILQFLSFALGLFLLILGGKWLVDGASTLARWLKISTMIVGLTIVAMGTSAPELVVNIKSALMGSTALALGNVIGSNIANILLILGISALITPLTLDKNTSRKDIPYVLLASVIIIVFASDKFFDGALVNSLSRVESFALLGFFCIFLSYVYFSSVSKQKDEIIEDIPRNTLLKALAMIPAGIALLTIGGDMTVKNAVDIALTLGLTERVVGLTIVAIGTSLPELVTSVIAAKKGKIDLLIGNIVGSNIFNIFFILGITGLVKPLEIGNVPLIDFGFMLGAVVLLIASLTVGQKQKIQKSQAMLMLISYVVYLTLVVLVK